MEDINLNLTHPPGPPLKRRGEGILVSLSKMVLTYLGQTFLPSLIKYQLATSYSRQASPPSFKKGRGAGGVGP